MSLSEYTESIVLKKINYKDKDIIYSVISQDLGKISIFARGVRSLTSKRLALMDTLNQVKIGIHTSNTGHKTLTEVQLVSSFSNLKREGNYKTIYFILNLIHKSTQEGNEHDKYGNKLVFSIILDLLKNLNNTTDELKTLVYVDIFEYQFLKTLGYEMAIDNCAKCGKDEVINQNHFYFDAQMGGVLCSECAPNKIKHHRMAIDYLRHIKNGKYEDTGFDDGGSHLLRDYVYFVTGVKYT